MLTQKEMAAASCKKTLLVRYVWNYNLRKEIACINEAILQFPCISLDTEFPGTIINTDVKHWLLSPEENYSLMKSNVDALNLIQLGITLSDADGNLPDFGTDFYYVWEFNFRDFDINADLYNKDSIELLKKQGIDFSKNSQWGVDSRKFSMWFMESNLVSSRSHVTWSTFHGSYDFAYLIKVITQSDLPDDLSGFMNQMYLYFGLNVYDIKKMMNSCSGLRGGLESVAQTLKVERVGKPHRAASDSLLTLRVFLKLKDVYFSGKKEKELSRYKLQLYGLDRPKSSLTTAQVSGSPLVLNGLLPPLPRGGGYPLPLVQNQWFPTPIMRRPSPKWFPATTMLRPLSIAWIVTPMLQINSF